MLRVKKVLVKRDAEKFGGFDDEISKPKLKKKKKKNRIDHEHLTSSTTTKKPKRITTTREIVIGDKDDEIMQQLLIAQKEEKQLLKNIVNSTEEWRKWMAIHKKTYNRKGLYRLSKYMNELFMIHLYANPTLDTRRSLQTKSLQINPEPHYQRRVINYGGLPRSLDDRRMYAALASRLA